MNIHIVHNTDFNDNQLDTPIHDKNMLYYDVNLSKCCVSIPENRLRKWNDRGIVILILYFTDYRVHKRMTNCEILGQMFYRNYAKYYSDLYFGWSEPIIVT